MDANNERVRPLLDTEEDWGQITHLVLEEYDKGTVLDEYSAQQRYLAANCPSAISVLALAAAKPNQIRLRFANISFVTTTIDGAEDTRIEGELDIGIPALSISPWLWLLYFAARVGELPVLSRAVFETVCYFYVLMQDGKEEQRAATDLN